jgi:hypothetical protein
MAALRPTCGTEQSQVHLDTHVLAGHPVRDIAKLAADIEVIGATGHSAMYERMVGSRADRIIRLAQCPVLPHKGLSQCVAEIQHMAQQARGRPAGAF